MIIRIGTRASELALTQTNLVAERLSACAGVSGIEIIRISTLGDRKQGSVAARESDKRDWIHELEVALLENQIDLAVHSGKDVPAEISSATELRSVLKRENPFDVFVGQLHEPSGKRLKFSELPQGALVGTASLRRRAQLLRLRSDLKIQDHRGNVPTRMKKLDQDKSIAGIVLASAGLSRLGYKNMDFEHFNSQQIMPAINQGTLVVQLMKTTLALQAVIQNITDPDTQAAFLAERACVELLNADCDSALSIFAETDAKILKLQARVLLPDGSKEIHAESSGEPSMARLIGTQVGKELLAKGSQAILAQSKSFRA